MKLQYLPILATALLINSCTKLQPKPTPKKTSSKPEAITAKNISYRTFQLLAHNPNNVNFSPLALKAVTIQLRSDLNEDKKIKISQMIEDETETKKSKSYTTALSIWNRNKKTNINAKEINEWLAKNTCGNPTAFNEKLDLKNNTIMFSTLCFKGRFSVPFKPENTILTHFQSSPHESSTIKVMKKTDELRYFEDENSKWVELDFEDSTAKLWLALPKKQFELGKIEKSINADYLQNVEKKLSASRVEIVLPKFILDQKTSVKEILAAAGMDYSFKTKKYNFTEISQVAIFNLNENGINASENIQKPAEKKSGFYIFTKSFYATEPFIAIIKDGEEILTLTRVYKP